MFISLRWSCLGLLNVGLTGMDPHTLFPKLGSAGSS